MQFVRAHLQIPDAHIKFAFGYSRDAWVQLEDRAGFALDTRFVPAADTVAADRACIYLLLRGRWILHGEEARVFDGPSAFILSAAQLEGSNGLRPFTFRSEGEPLEAIEIHLSTAHILAPRGVPTPLQMDERAWAAAAHAFAGLDVNNPPAAMEAPFLALLGELGRLGIATTEAPATITDSMPPALARVLGAMARHVERMDLGGTLKELETTTGTSQRQVARDIESAVRMLGLAGLGWRLASRHLRIKIAVMLLSGQHASVGKVAQLLGWGSADAMTRAFRNAGIAPPSTVQREVRAAR
jgi:AraC-like DNA-binding protein